MLARLPRFNTSAPFFPVPNFTTFLAAFFLITGLVPSALAGTPLTLTTDYLVEPGNETRFVEYVEGYRGPTFARLMREGTVLSWAVSVPLPHAPGEHNRHTISITVPDGAAFDRFLGAIAESDDAEAAKGVDRGAEFRKVAPLEEHSSAIYRHVVLGGGASAPKGATPYLWQTSFRTNPLRAGEMIELWKEVHEKPMGELVSKGLLYGYGLAAPEAPTKGVGQYVAWFSVPGFGAYEKLRAALEQHQGEMLARRPELSAKLPQLFDFDSFETKLTRDVVFRTANQVE